MYAFGDMGSSVDDVILEAEVDTVTGVVVGIVNK